MGSTNESTAADAAEMQVAKQAKFDNERVYMCGFLSVWVLWNRGM